jgi:hypothetical protein
LFATAGARGALSLQRRLFAFLEPPPFHPCYRFVLQLSDSAHVVELRICSHRRIPRSNVRALRILQHASSCGCGAEVDSCSAIAAIVVEVG